MIILKILSVVIVTFVAIFTLTKEIRKKRQKNEYPIIAYLFLVLTIVGASFSLITLIIDHIEFMQLRKAVYVVKSMEITIALTFPTVTENADIGTMRIALGEFNIAGLESEDGIFYELHSDEMVSSFTISKRSIAYRYVYKPAIGTDILGRHMKHLKDISIFIFNYTDDLSGYVDRVGEHCEVNLYFLLRINAISIGNLEALLKYHELTSNDMQLDISAIFKNIDKKYVAYIKRDK
jgi:hypothetical protein